MRRQYVQFADDDSNFYQVVLFDGQLVQVEKLTPPKSLGRREWEYDNYHQALCHGLLGGAAAAGWIDAPASGWDDLLFISPANHFSLECELRVEIKPESDETLCTLQTDNTELAVEVLERVFKGQFIHYERAELGAFLEETINVLKLVPVNVGGHKDGEGVHAQRSRNLIDFLQSWAFQAPLQRAEVRAAAYCREIFLREISTASDLFERLAERDAEFQFAVSTKGTMKRYRIL